MMARIIMEYDGEEYVYGEYPFDTDEQKDRVNRIALRVGQEREGVLAYVMPCT